jgi:NADH:ubiquinone oxidoreductase subunit 5 (subunit L)/multisubunit Na+/H+ antiporter MnhA subunit
MIFAVGANEKSFCFFHLLSHACFKALLFMCVGVYIHILYGTQEQRRLNNLAAAIPAASFISLAVLSLMGFLFTSGFYRKDSILESIYRGESHGTAILLFLLGIGLTTFYSTKILVRTILNPAFSLVSTVSVSALRLYVKLPVYILGFLRVAFGITVGDYRSGFTLVINRIDKQLSFVMILVGLLTGFLVSNLNRLKLRSLLCITPTTWYLAYVPGIVGDLDKEIERTSRGAMVFPSMVLAIQPALTTLGLRIIVCIIMFYVEYSKSQTLCHYAVRRWYNH